MLEVLMLEGNTTELKKSVTYVSLVSEAKKAVEALEAAVVTLDSQEKIDAAKALVEPAEKAIAALPEGNENIATLTTRVNNAKDSIARTQPVVTATEAVVKAEGSLLEADLKAASDLVKALPTSDAATLLKARVDVVNAQIAAILKKVNDATTDIQLYDALNVKPFVNVNKDFITDYNTVLDGTPGTLAAVQTVIDGVNKAKADNAAAKLVADATTAVAKVDGRSLCNKPNSNISNCSRFTTNF